MASQHPEMMTVDKLLGLAAPYNPREILEHDYEQLKHSLKTYGVVQSIVVNKRTAKLGWEKGSKPAIVGGHQRVRVASDPEVGIEELPVFWVDLNEVQERSLNLILNRTSGDWEEDMLERALREIEALGGGEALDFTGLDTDELEHYLGSPDGTIGGEGGDFEPPNDETNHACPKCGFKWNE